MVWRMKGGGYPLVIQFISHFSFVSGKFPIRAQFRPSLPGRGNDRSSPDPALTWCDSSLDRWGIAPVMAQAGNPPEWGTTAEMARMARGQAPGPLI